MKTKYWWKKRERNWIKRQPKKEIDENDDNNARQQQAIAYYNTLINSLFTFLNQLFGFWRFFEPSSTPKSTLKGNFLAGNGSKNRFLKAPFRRIFPLYVWYVYQRHTFNVYCYLTECCCISEVIAQKQSVVCTLYSTQ